MDERERDKIRTDGGLKAYNMGGENIQIRMADVAQRLDGDPRDIPLYVGSMFLVGAMAPLAMAFAKRDPDIFNTEHCESLSSKESQQLCWTLVNPETLVWTALVSAYMVTHTDADNVSTAWGPRHFVPILEAWQKLFPDRKPEDVLDPHLIRAIRECETEADEPLNQFLKTRSGSLPPSTNSIN